MNAGSQARGVSCEDDRYLYEKRIQKEYNKAIEQKKPDVIPAFPGIRFFNI
jgi:hypothetical protein